MGGPSLLVAHSCTRRRRSSCNLTIGVAPLAEPRPGVVITDPGVAATPAIALGPLPLRALSGVAPAYATSDLT
jgi:hypothetical protein